jgi:hypothetical protein
MELSDEELARQEAHTRASKARRELPDDWI